MSPSQLVIATQETAMPEIFKEQAECWIKAMETRKRRPVKPATLYTWRSFLKKWLLPNLGEMELSAVGNGAMKKLVEHMEASGLSARSILLACSVVKMVMASAVDDEGNARYPRTWNHEFIAMPIVDVAKQKRHTVSGQELQTILIQSKPRYALLFALLAGTGLRIGEALGLQHGDFSEDFRVLTVKRSVWKGKTQDPKTSNAFRDIDVPEPLAAKLRERVARKPGFVFSTRSGKPMSYRNVLRNLYTRKKIGLHAFRRFRVENLRRAGVPEDLVRIWLGHAAKSLTDLYADGLEKDLAWRREWCDKAGLGFAVR
jgi:integrase